MTPAALPRAALTPGQVVDGAADLTRETHLLGWSIRDLATRLAIAPSVVYHHVGGKDLLCRRVVERMLMEISVPAEDLPWQDWFRELLHTAGPAAARYPGTAGWMLQHGPTLPAALPVLEAGMAMLHEAGFGDRSPFAYCALLNNAMLTVSVGDDRLLHDADGPRDHATMMAEFREMPTASPAVRAMGEDLIRPLAEGGPTADRMRWAYFSFIVDVTIRGLEPLLPPRP